MNEMTQPEPRPPRPATRFIHAGYDPQPKPGEIQASKDWAGILHTVHVGHNVAAAQIVSALHVQSRIQKATGKHRNFNRPKVAPAKAVSTPVKAK